MTKKIIISPEFGGGTIWWHADSIIDGHAYIKLQDLPVKYETAKRILHWQFWYESIFDEDYPPDSHFRNKREQEAFEEEGVSLLRHLQIELDEDYQVFYRSVSTNRIISVADLDR